MCWERTRLAAAGGSGVASRLRRHGDAHRATVEGAPFLSPRETQLSENNTVCGARWPDSVSGHSDGLCSDPVINGFLRGHGAQ